MKFLNDLENLKNLGLLQEGIPRYIVDPFKALSAGHTPTQLTFGLHLVDFQTAQKRLI